MSEKFFLIDNDNGQVDEYESHIDLINELKRGLEDDMTTEEFIERFIVIKGEKLEIALEKSIKIKI